MILGQNKKIPLFSVVQQKCGYFVVLRRPKSYIPKYTEFLPCPQCYGFVLIHMLSSHADHCPLKKPDEKETNLKQTILKQKSKFKLMEDIGKSII